MRCLWITRQDPRPQDSGDLIYSLGLIRALAAQPGVDLTVLAHHGKTPSSGDVGIRWELHGVIPKGRIPGILSRLPSDSWRLGNPLMRGALRSLLDQNAWDWVVIDQAACGWAMDLFPANQRFAYIAHNHEAVLRGEVARSPDGSLPLRLALRHDAAKYATLEGRLCERASLVSAITPRDAEAFQTANPSKSVIILPPGYGREIGISSPPLITAETPLKVALAGTFEWLAKRRNLETFLLAAAEPFREKRIEFLVVGKAEPEYFQALGEKHPWAAFHANVPSMAPFLQGARIGLIPEALGGGFKLKALDYIFAGLPLGSIESALSGIPIDPDADCIAAGTPEKLAIEVAGKIHDTDFLNRAAGSAFMKSRHQFDWASRGRLLASAMHIPS